MLRHLNSAVGSRWAKIGVIGTSALGNGHKMKAGLVALYPKLALPCVLNRTLTCSGLLRTNEDESNTEASNSRPIEGKKLRDLIQEAKLASSSRDEEEAPPEFPSDIEMNNFKRDQTRGSYRPNIDPAETSVLLFPGQGSQFVGMGEKLLSIPKALEIYSTAKKILGYDLLDLCMNGPKEELDKTVHCQPAVFVTSLAAVEKLKEENETAIINCTTAAGFSVGEFAALVFAGSISFEEALRVVNKRAKAMQHASEQIHSGMMTAILGPDNKAKMAAHTAALYCIRELGMPPESVDCIIANYLFPECKVFAGNIEALEFIEKHKKEFGIKRVKYLPVSGAFHTHLMSPAVHVIKEALSNVKLSEPIISVHSNVDANRYRNVSNMAKLLRQQIVSPVRWEQTLHKIYQRDKDMPYPKTYELGPGKQLGAMLKMTNGKAYREYRPVEV